MHPASRWDTPSSYLRPYSNELFNTNTFTADPIYLSYYIATTWPPWPFDLVHGDVKRRCTPILRRNVYGRDGVFGGDH